MCVCVCVCVCVRVRENERGRERESNIIDIRASSVVTDRGSLYTPTSPFSFTAATSIEYSVKGVSPVSVISRPSLWSVVCGIPLGCIILY